jgi:hypothetical protein
MALALSKGLILLLDWLAFMLDDLVQELVIMVLKMVALVLIQLDSMVVTQSPVNFVERLDVMLRPVGP